MFHVKHKQDILRKELKKGVFVGWFDNFKRAKNEEHNEEQAEQPIQDHAESTEDALDSEIHDTASEQMVEKGFEIDTISVVEREVSQNDASPAKEEGNSTVDLKPIKSYAEKKPVTHVIGSTKIIAVINQKGGVGKSTTAVNLSAALGEMGKQVLLVDLDPQGNTSSGLGIDKRQVKYCIYDVLLNDVPIQDVIIPDVCDGLDLVPATINLAGAEVELVSEMARENRLKDAVGVMRGRYDYIFIDCPPSLGLLTVNALVAADKLLIPIQCEFYALEGVTKLLDSMKRVKSRLNPTLDIFGVLLTMYDGRTTLSKQVVSEVRNYFGKSVFETLIPRTVKLSEAPSFGQPITQYDPTGKGSLSYVALAKEVIKRG